MIKLSIIIPVFNGAKFIEKSYNSIRNQELENFEIIYVDNNSNDDSVNKIKVLLKNDSRVKLLSQTKQGAAPARNKGIEKAQGDYIYIFDVDDEIYPDALRRMIAVLDSHPVVDAVFGKMVKSQKGIAETHKPTDETHNVTLFEKPHWGLQWFSSLKTVVGPPAFLYRKSVFNTIGVYNEDLQVCEDTAFDIKLGMTMTVAHLDTYVYLYFKHSNSSLELSKKSGSEVFILWSRLSKSHLPFYLTNEVPVRYKELLFFQLYSTMGKIIYYTPTLEKRKAWLKQIEKDINPYKLSFSIQSYLSILVYVPNKSLFKYYVYYFSKRYVKKNFNSF